MISIHSDVVSIAARRNHSLTVKIVQPLPPPMNHLEYRTSRVTKFKRSQVMNALVK